MANTRIVSPVFLAEDKEKQPAAVSELISTARTLTTVLLSPLENRENALHADGPSGYAHQVFISHRGTHKEDIAFPIMAIFSIFAAHNLQLMMK